MNTPVSPWKEAPFLRLFPLLAAGILAGYHFPLHPKIYWLLLCAALTGSFLTVLTGTRLWFRLRKAGGGLVAILPVLLGNMLVYYNDDSKQANWIGKPWPDSCLFLINIREPLSEKTNSYATTARVEKILWGDTVVIPSGNIYCYFLKDSVCRQIRAGDLLICQKKWQPLRNAGNPGEFNFSQYAARQGIYGQLFLKPADYRIIRKNQISPLQSFLFKARSRILGIIRKHIRGEQETALAEALLTGYKNDLEKNLVRAYANTGTVHIIAISGLHLGVVYGLMVLLLKPFSRWKKFILLKPVLLLTGLWIFSLFTGSSPSVLRSALMFSFLVIGEKLPGRNSVYNSLAASAFLLLCYDPFLLWNTGFQLSYSAVLGIVLFSRNIYNLFFLKNKIADFAWKMQSVTIAAQLFTLPICLWQFHQLPVLFLPANLVAVPLSSLILIAGLLLSFVSVFPPLADIMGWLLSRCIALLNNWVLYIDRIPFSTWENLQVSPLQAILLYIAISAFLAFWIFRSKKALFTGMTVLVPFFVIRMVSFQGAYKQQKIIVYNIPRYSAIEFIHGRSFYGWMDSALQSDPELQKKILQPAHRILRTGNAFPFPCLAATEPLFLFHHLRILVLSKRYEFSMAGEKTPVDLVILAGNPDVQISLLLTSVSCSQVIADGSNPSWKAARWRKECQILGIGFHYTTEQGAFVMQVP